VRKITFDYFKKIGKAVFNGFDTKYLMLPIYAHR